jgi:hypothetical protein
VSTSWIAAGTARWSSDIELSALEKQTIPLLKTPKLVKTMGISAQLAIQAAAQANPVFSAPPERRGLIVCQGGDMVDYSELSPLFPIQTDGIIDYSRVARRTPPLWLLQQLPNMTTAHLAREWLIQGPTHSFNLPVTPLAQGWLTAQFIFEFGEADELLIAALNVDLKSKDQPSYAIVIHLSSPPDSALTDDSQELYYQLIGTPEVNS